MNAPRFDDLVRGLARRAPRRGLLGRAALLAAGGAAAPKPAMARQQDQGGFAQLPCVPCNCDAGECDCCLIGITGGGVVETERGNVNFVLFATQLAEDAAEGAAGFVRWIDPHVAGGLTLESVGAIAYDADPDDERARQVRGVLTVNGGEEQPFVLRVLDAGDADPGQDTARLTVGDEAGGGFGYRAEGGLVGGDLQLLNDVAPVVAD